MVYWGGVDLILEKFYSWSAASGYQKISKLGPSVGEGVEFLGVPKSAPTLVNKKCQLNWKIVSAVLYLLLLQPISTKCTNEIVNSRFLILLPPLKSSIVESLLTL